MSEDKKCQVCGGKGVVRTMKIGDRERPVSRLSLALYAFTSVIERDASMLEAVNVYHELDSQCKVETCTCKKEKP